ncbi:MAG: hypothetical protein ACTSUT_14095 [Promethearchaeota archaeon]
MYIPKHYIRFGKSSEKKILEEHQDSFESVVINANTLAYFGKSLSTFIFIKGKQKIFFIDPMTHAFQHPLDKISGHSGEIKSSIKKLIDIYGEPLKSKIIKEEVSVTANDFSDIYIIEKFTSSVLGFQSSHLFNSADKDFRSYLEDPEFKDLISTKPIFLVAPYFYLRSFDYKDWAKLNREFLEIAKKYLKSPEKIAGELVLDKDLLDKLIKDNRIMNQILEIYESADGVLFWIDDFDEHKESIERLLGLKKFVKRFREKYPAKFLINLYGGYFSQLLLKAGLTGVVHGPEYGESRAVVPVGGGIPIAKYYFPPLKKRVPSNEVIWLLKYLNVRSKEDYYNKVCKCKVCKNLIKNKPIENFIEHYGKVHPVEIKGRYGSQAREYPDIETIKNSLEHYLEVKKEEFRNIQNNNINSLLDELRNTYEEIKNLNYAEESEISYLDNWQKVLKNG